MQREVVSVDRLLLWQENPRVKAADSQMKELDNIYNFSNASSQKTSKRQLMKLVESIAENGYQNDVEPILVKREGDRFVVQDANRRLSSIKLLLDPDKYREILVSRFFGIYRFRYRGIQSVEGIASRFDRGCLTCLSVAAVLVATLRRVRLFRLMPVFTGFGFSVKRCPGPSVFRYPVPAGSS